MNDSQVSGAARTDANEPLCVLLALTNKWMRVLLTAALEYDGHHVVPVEHGMAALEYLSNSGIGRRPMPNLVVAEKRMPVVGGRELLSHLRQRHWKIPVILISLRVDPESHAEGDTLGAAAVLESPFDVNEFRSAVAHAVSTQFRANPAMAVVNSPARS